ncbi:MAG: hypothetical protein Kow0031_32710 [Anaerolineae bacterium]
MQIDWTLISFLTIGFFAINGFFRGWWKEALTTAIIVFFMFLLQQPEMAATTVNLVNQGIATAWNLSARLLGSFIPMTGGAPQLNPDDPMTWVVLLFIFLGAAGILGRILLPESGRSGMVYAANIVGRFLGLGLGAVNAFLVLNLVRAYLDGSSLPGQAAEAAAQSAAQAAGVATTGITVYGGQTATAASEVMIQAVGMPQYTLQDNITPWLVIGGGLFVVALAANSRVKVMKSQDGARKVTTRPPFGYSPRKIG